MSVAMDMRPTGPKVEQYSREFLLRRIAELEEENRDLRTRVQFVAGGIQGVVDFLVDGEIEK